LITDPNLFAHSRPQDRIAIIKAFRDDHSAGDVSDAQQLAPPLLPKWQGVNLAGSSSWRYSAPRRSASPSPRKISSTPEQSTSATVHHPQAKYFSV
jgi:hypothetical protein